MIGGGDIGLVILIILACLCAGFLIMSLVEAFAMSLFKIAEYPNTFVYSASSNAIGFAIAITVWGLVLIVVFPGLFFSTEDSAGPQIVLTYVLPILIFLVFFVVRLCLYMLMKLGKFWHAVLYASASTVISLIGVGVISYGANNLVLAIY